MARELETSPPSSSEVEDVTKCASHTRISVARAYCPPSEPSSIVAAAGRPLQLAARRLLTNRVRFERSVLEAWHARCTEESSSLDAAFGTALGELLDAISRGQEQLAQSLTVSWFSAADRMLVSGVSLALLAEAVEEAACIAVGADASAPMRELGRFLMRVAVQTLSRQDSSAAPLQSDVFDRVAVDEDLGLIGVSRAMSDLRQELRDVAQAPGSVLLVGESGTGKELVARALHDLAGRAGPYVAVNCAALPRELCESELFGHERGAFTGSSREGAKGLLRAAQDGTLFLDELTEMPEALQPKLLRVLEQRTVRPVGGIREFPVNARIIAATNRDPGHAVQSGQLRADLFFRVCVHRICLPPLRDRAEDIPILAAHFLLQLAKTGRRVSPCISEATRAKLQAYEFPGNVRELRNVIEHSVAVARGAPIEPQHLPRYLPTQKASTVAEATGSSLLGSRASSPLLPATTPSQVVPLQQAERVLIACALEEAQGNKALAARLLGVSRHQLYSKLERLGFQAGPSSDRRVP